MDDATGKLSIKLLIDKRSKRVLFGEAGKDFVDFIFHILSLPIGTVVKLLSKEKMVGSLGKVYDSIENMHENHMQPKFRKENVLSPKVSSSNSAGLLLCRDFDHESIKSKVFYRCSRSKNVKCRGYFADDWNARCPNCQSKMFKIMTYVDTSPARKEVVEGAGYVKGLVTYMALNNLVVKPMSTMSSSIDLLNSFNVIDLSDLEERTVYMGKNEAVKLLKTSLMSEKVDYCISW